MSIEDYRRRNNQWYKDMAKGRDIPPNCPYANIHDCYHYFQSVRIVEDALYIISEDKRKDFEETERQFKDKDLWYANRFPYAHISKGTNYRL